MPAYVKCLRNGHLGGDEEIEAMDAELPEHTILVFRRMAHAKVQDPASPLLIELIRIRMT